MKELFFNRGEIDRFEQFLLLSQCFQKSAQRRQKASVWGRVKVFELQISEEKKKSTTFLQSNVSV